MKVAAADKPDTRRRGWTWWDLDPDERARKVRFLHVIKVQNRMGLRLRMRYVGHRHA